MRGFENWFNGAMCLEQKIAAETDTDFTPPLEWQTLAATLKAGGVTKIPKRRFWEEETSTHTDDDTPIKRTVYWKGFNIGLQYQPFDERHDKVLPCGYGEIIGTNGQDGMALDCYVGTDLDSDRVFVIDQLNAATGEFDEPKLFIGFTDDAPAIKDLFVSLMGQERFGGIRETVPAKVWDLHEDSEHEDATPVVETAQPGAVVIDEVVETPPQKRKKKVKEKSVVPASNESLAQIYTDAEARALAADGDVLETFDTDIDTEAAVFDWGEDGGIFANLLDSDDQERQDKACGKSFIEETDECTKAVVPRSHGLNQTIEKGKSLFTQEDFQHLDKAAKLEEDINANILGLIQVTKNPLKWLKIPGIIAENMKMTSQHNVLLEKTEKIRNRIIAGESELEQLKRTTAAKMKVLKDVEVDIFEDKGDVVLSHVVDFHKMVNAKMQKIEIKESDKDVSFYSPRQEGVEVPFIGLKGLSRESIFHELGHHLEASQPQIMKMAKEWLKSRASGTNESLGKLLNNNRYKNVIATPDNFVNPYVGRIYENDATEVVSMGLEHMASAQTLQKIYRKDKEHLFFALGAAHFVKVSS